MTLFSVYKNFLAESKFCFSHMHTKERIRKENWQQLVHLCVATLILFVGYGIWFAIALHNAELFGIYLVYTAVFAGISLWICSRRNTPPSLQKVQQLCHEFILLVMSFFIIISVVPFPSQPATFFPLGYLLMNIIFFLPYKSLNFEMLFLEAVFLVAACLVKTPAALYYDIPCTVTASIFGCVASFLIQDLHIRETRMQYELEYVSEHDELTALSNRRGFDLHITQTYEQCCSERSLCGIIMMDIDHFKLYNDSYGHLAGDNCLQRVSRAMKSTAKQHGAFLARFGGEEFISVIHRVNEQAVQHYAEKLLHAVRREAIPMNGDIVTISLGVCTQVPQKADDWMQQVDRADHALYTSKKSGRNRISYWQKESQ